MYKKVLIEIARELAPIVLDIVIKKVFKKK